MTSSLKPCAQNHKLLICSAGGAAEKRGNAMSRGRKGAAAKKPTSSGALPVEEDRASPASRQVPPSSWHVVVI